MCLARAPFWPTGACLQHGHGSALSDTSFLMGALPSRWHHLSRRHSGVWLSVWEGAWGGAPALSEAAGACLHHIVSAGPEVWPPRFLGVHVASAWKGAFPCGN